MKRTLAIVSLLATIASPSAADECPDPPAPLVCGHRGTGVNAPDNPFPENTLPSFEQAVTEGAAMVELDVMHSADGALVVIHDDTVDRTTDGSGCVGDMTLAQLTTLDAGAGGSLEGTGVMIPTLAEVLAAVDAAVNVEIKLPDSASCPEPNRELLAADVVDLIHARPDRTVVVSSFDAEVLVAVHTLDPDVYLGLLGMDPAGDIEIAHESGFDAVNPFFLGVTPEVVSAAHDLGLEVNPWTVDDITFLGLMADAGVDSIITDEPDVLVALLEERADAPCEPDPPVEPADAGEVDAAVEEDAGGTKDIGGAEEGIPDNGAASADAVALHPETPDDPLGGTQDTADSEVGATSGVAEVRPADGGCAAAVDHSRVRVPILALVLLVLGLAARSEERG